jgi:hypothetical protein
MKDHFCNQTETVKKSTISNVNSLIDEDLYDITPYLPFSLSPNAMIVQTISPVSIAAAAVSLKYFIFNLNKYIKKNNLNLIPEFSRGK